MDYSLDLPMKCCISDMFNSAILTNKNLKLKRVWNALKWRQTYQNMDHYTLKFVNQTTMTVNQILNGELKGFGTGTLVWPAAHVLIKYLEKRFGSNGLCGKRVCDIGSGTGITGFASAIFGAYVVLTDQIQLIPLLQDNTSRILSQNLVTTGNITIVEYNWGENVSEVMLANHNLDFDYILVSDCVLPKLYPIEILVRGVEAIMGANTVVFFLYEHRPFPYFDPRQEFERIAFQFNLRVKVIPLNEHHELFSVDDVEIWEVTRIEHLTTSSIVQHSNILQIWNWGNVPHINVTLSGVNVSFSQNPGGVVGSVLWPASVVLARFLLVNSLADCRTQLMCETGNISCTNCENGRPFVIELGAGCGLTSVAMDSVGYDVLATDKYLILNLLQLNVMEWQKCFINSIEVQKQSNIVVQELDWFAVGNGSASLHAMDNLRRVPDLIVCSDCIYSSASVQPLLNVLEMLAGSDTIIILANEMRTAYDEFTCLARRMEYCDVTFLELNVPEPQLELFRDRTGRFASPPLKMCLMQLRPKKNKSDGDVVNK